MLFTLSFRTRTGVLALLAMLVSLTLSAQGGRIQGRLTDTAGQPLSFANITLLKPGNLRQPQQSSLSDSLGAFFLSAPASGTYVVQVSLIGFARLQTDSFALSGPDDVKDFGNLQLRQEAVKLKDVSVTALRPSIVQLPDRLVVNVEGTAMAAGNTAFQVLAKAPGVFVDAEGNIQLNGRGGVSVMIDGRLTYLSARDLRNLLETMPADNIKSIEVITAPSSRFDAEGSSGIINIVLRKNTVRGLSGSFSTSYNYNFKQHANSVGANVNVKTGRLNAYTFVDFNNRAGGREATFTRIFYTPTRNTYFNQVATGNWRSVGPPSVRVGADYEISSRHSVGAMVNVVNNRLRSDFLTETYIANVKGEPFQFIDADNYNTNKLSSYTGNLHYVFKLDTLGSTLSADVDYARITNRGEGNFYNRFTDLYTDKDTTDNLYTSTPNGYHVRAAKIDLIRQLSKGRKLEAGLKASDVESDNDFRFYFNNNGLVNDPLRTNHFVYSENIYAAYANYTTPLGKRLSLQAGLRAEQTKSIGTSYTTGQVTPRSYLDFFPSIFIQQKVSDNYGINYNVSRRIQRPNYGSLNPFRSYRDPYTWTVGNPYLRPAYTHIVNVSQTFKKQYILQLYYHYTKDVMIELPMLDVANATTIYTQGNVDDGIAMGATAIIPIKVFKFWDTRNTLQLSHSRFTTVSVNGALENEQLSYSLQSVHTLMLPKDYRFEMSFLFRGPNAAGLYLQEAVNWVDVALRKSYFKKKFDASITVSDIFKGFRYRWSTNINGNVNDFDQYFRFRAIGVSLRYNFSRGMKTNNRQAATVEELNRT